MRVPRLCMLLVQIKRRQPAPSFETRCSSLRRAPSNRAHGIANGALQSLRKIENMLRTFATVEKS